jgi:exopolyphosphatase/guanosine-5'-triphosphate,3'-diphosphate pyrophosphatase
MGGGSLELLAVDEDKADKGLTLPLGALTLKNLAKGDVKTARKIALEHCAKLDVLKAGKAKPFFAVGGTWRSIAHLHMQYINYPLSVVHDYRVQASEILEFLKKLQKPEDESDVKLGSISSRRRALIPYGAAVMEAVLEVSKASEVVFSANGVREGLLYDRLSAEERSEDPLIAAARDLGYLRSRSPLYAHEVFLWCSQIFQHQSVAETADERRLRQAACYLSDIGWRAHPDYRGEQSFSTLLNAALSGTDHQGRGYLALVNLLRYAGSGTATPENIAPLLNDRATHLARLLAASMRVAYVISASMPGVLGKTAMTIDDTSLTLILGRNQKDLQSRRLDSRLATLAKLMDREAVVKVRLI